MNPNEPAKNEDGEKNEQYKRICQLIWNLKGSIHQPLPDGSARKAVFPPVCRKEVAFLIIGQSPNDNGVPYDGNDKQQTVEHAMRYEFIRRNPCNRFDHRYNHAYYEKLIAFVRQVDERLGVWWEVEKSKKELCLEFADALPLATKPRTLDFDSVIKQHTVRNSCKDILSAILDYYEPRVILANGSLASDLLRELHAQNRDALCSTSTFIVSQDHRRQVYLSRFIDERFDRFSRDRLLMEMKTQWPRL